MTEDLINAMKELVRCYEEVNETSSASRKEIEMWRNRFLNSLPKLDSPSKGAQVWTFFLALPCESMMTYPPEKHIEWIMGRVNEN